MAAGEQKKLILPYLQRADEVAKMDPKVAYYCRMYAVDQGIAIPNRAPEITDVIKALMAKLEQDKPKAKLNPPEDAAYCENFAVTIFERADKADRAGRADKNTAMTYYAASVFIEILRQFGELPTDMAERQRYAAWKAADIRKAIREGRAPKSGPPVSDDNTLLPLPSADLPSVLDSLPDPSPAAPPPPDVAARGVPGASPSAGLSGPGSNSFSGPPSGGFPSPPGHAPSPSASGQLSPGSFTSPGSFRPGDRVLYCLGQEDPPVRGTVAKLEPSTDGRHYKVALSQRIISAAEGDLAHEYEPGTRVRFQRPDHTTHEATVVQLDINCWRPLYTIKLDSDGSMHETHDRALQRLERERSPDPIIPGPGPPPVSISPPRTDRSVPPPPPTAHGSPGTTPPPFSRTPSDFTQGPGNAGPPAYPTMGGGQGGPSGNTGYSQPPPPSNHGQPSAPFASAPPPPTASTSGQPPVPQFAHPPSSISLAAMTEAHKHAKYACSSLSFEDVASARKFLSEALRLISDPAAYQAGKHK